MTRNFIFFLLLTSEENSSIFKIVSAVSSTGIHKGEKIVSGDSL